VITNPTAQIHIESLHKICSDFVDLSNKFSFQVKASFVKFVNTVYFIFKLSSIEPLVNFTAMLEQLERIGSFMKLKQEICLNNRFFDAQLQLVYREMECACPRLAFYLIQVK
jgi:hypothetical protein